MLKPQHMNLVGHTYERLTVINFLNYRGNGKVKYPYWLCECQCGVKVEVSTGNLRSGAVLSCGCLRNERIKTHGLRSKNFKYAHLVNVYDKMIVRCHTKDNWAYFWYGARGIYVCDEWQEWTGLVEFLEWALENGYKRGLQIDRIDNDGPYAPWNCRWVTPKENSRNKRNSIKVPYNGSLIPLYDFINEGFTELSSTVISDRRKNGWTWEDILNTSLGNRRYK